MVSIPFEHDLKDRFEAFRISKPGYLPVTSPRCLANAPFDVPRRAGAALGGMKIDKVAGIETRGFIIGRRPTRFPPVSCLSQESPASHKRGRSLLAGIRVDEMEMRGRGGGSDPLSWSTI